MDDDSATEFETLAEMLLLGWVDRDGQHQYFKHGSREERAARYAIAQLLRDDDEARILKRWYFRHRLADLFDPSVDGPVDNAIALADKSGWEHPVLGIVQFGHCRTSPIDVLTYQRAGLARMALTREFTARSYLGHHRLSVPAPNSLSLTFPDAVPIHGGLDGGPNRGVVRLVLLTNSDRSPHFLGNAPMF